MKAELHLVIVAAGSSRRFGGGDKLFCLLGGKPVLVHSILKLAPAVTGKMAVVVPPGRVEEYQRLAEPYLGDLRPVWCAGGACRSESVRHGIAALGEDAAGFAAVHDAARPLATAELLETLLKAAEGFDGALPGKRVVDTLWRITPENELVETVSRESLFAVETPQLFRLEAWKEASRRFPDGDFTDDAGLLRHAGFRMAACCNPAPNPKLTTPGDLELLRSIESGK